MRSLQFGFRLLAGLALAASPVAAAQPEARDSGEDSARAKFFSQFKWVKGPAKASIGDVAEVQLPEGYMFTGAEGTQEILKASGNPTSGDELGFLAPTNFAWSVIFEFDAVGYVKDDDKDKLDPDQMLASIRKGTEQANKHRARMGAPPMRVVGWELPPRYNETTHNLEWAIKGESEGSVTVNYNTRLLGRKGVMSATLLVDPEAMTDTLPTYQQLLGGYTYKSGQSYAEYRQGDTVAKYGLAALVVGGAAVGAAKLGLFAWLGVTVKKAWKLIVVALVGLAALVKRLILGGRKADY